MTHWCTYCQGINAHNCQFNIDIPRVRVYVSDSTAPLPSHPEHGLEPEFLELKRDAERYRWLRDNRVSAVTPDGILTTRMGLHFVWDSPIWKDGARCDPVTLDEAIDRCR